MSERVDAIIESLKALSLLEASELVKAIEETFGVKAEGGGSGGFNPAMFAMAAPAAPAAPAAEAAPEQTEFDVVLTEVPADKKIAILKVVRALTGLGLKEAKDLVEAAPKAVKEAVTKDEAEKIKAELEKEGAKITIK
ncbi:50S ribosomal protein L7/L12 [Anthocerotibacter panamensis]|uniref:50S ribosomal protein L7/L12 n=1 Tax=Anthocerotibacter panamensis TaxID=2857077 RepID=UPI001C403235|nr:50S ribosomal protein L7/L12 [Anthocerotibacter panamensis]